MHLQDSLDVQLLYTFCYAPAFHNSQLQSPLQPLRRRGVLSNELQVYSFPPCAELDFCTRTIKFKFNSKKYFFVPGQPPDIEQGNS